MIFKKFEVYVSSDLEYENVIAIVYYEDQTIATLTQEKGFENLEIEIYPPQKQEQNLWVFPFFEFDEAIQYAKKRLSELRIPPEEYIEESE